MTSGSRASALPGSGILHARRRAHQGTPLVCYRTGLLCTRACMYSHARLATGRYIHAVAPPPRTPGAASSEASPLCSAPRERGGSAPGRPPCSRVGPHGCTARWLAQRREEVIRTGAKAATRGSTRRVKHCRRRAGPGGRSTQMALAIEALAKGKVGSGEDGGIERTLAGFTRILKTGQLFITAV